MIVIGRGSVQQEECDVMGHMNVRHYVARGCDALQWLLLEAGLPPSAGGYTLRDQQVKAYADWLVRAKQPVPHYSVTPIRRSDLPRKWTPLPALGFLRGQMI